MKPKFRSSFTDMLKRGQNAFPLTVMIMSEVVCHVGCLRNRFVTQSAWKIRKYVNLSDKFLPILNKADTLLLLCTLKKCHVELSYWSHCDCYWFQLHFEMSSVSCLERNCTLNCAFTFIFIFAETSASKLHKTKCSVITTSVSMH